ncbi:hypothetical protein I3843_09G164800 [Carya illinoinensis]|nr:hypothetical protein I3843_09G164800 [Carya illinoinensis]
MVNYGEDGSLVGQALGLLPNGHQFESLQGHWRFIWSLTSGPRGISRGARKLARTPMDIKNKKNCEPSQIDITPVGGVENVSNMAEIF